MWAKSHGGRHQNIRDSRKPGESLSSLTFLLCRGLSQRRSCLLIFLELESSLGIRGQVKGGKRIAPFYKIGSVPTLDMVIA